MLFWLYQHVILILSPAAYFSPFSDPIIHNTCYYYYSLVFLNYLNNLVWCYAYQAYQLINTGLLYQLTGLPAYQAWCCLVKFWEKYKKTVPTY